MIYIMSIYEKVDILSFFDVRASKWLQNGPDDPQAQKSWGTLKNTHQLTAPQLPSLTIPHHAPQLPSLIIPHHPSVLKFLSSN